MLTRRKLFSLLPGVLALTSGLAYAGYRYGGCPLSGEGYCVGPCSALLDFDGNGLCDRLVRVFAQEPLSAPYEEETSLPSLETESLPSDTPTAISSSVIATATISENAALTPTPKLAVTCPFGLVNDRYPGRCRRYVDRNKNDICDYSELQLAH